MDGTTLSWSLRKQRMHFTAVKLELTLLLLAAVKACDAQGNNKEETPFSFLWLVVSIVVLAVSATIVVITVLLCYFFVYKVKRKTKQQCSDDESRCENTMSCISESLQPSHQLLLYTQWIQDTQEESASNCASNSTDER